MVSLHVNKNTVFKKYSVIYRIELAYLHRLKRPRVNFRRPSTKLKPSLFCYISLTFSTFLPSSDPTGLIFPLGAFVSEHFLRLQEAAKDTFARFLKRFPPF